MGEREREREREIGVKELAQRVCYAEGDKASTHTADIGNFSGISRLESV